MLRRIPVFRRLYAWTRAWSRSKSSSWALFALTAADNLILPVPAEVLEYTLCAARPERSFWYAAIVIGGTAVGASIAYLIGLLLYDVLLQYLDIRLLEREFGKGYFWPAFLAPLTPLSDKLVTYGAGIFRAPFLVYLGAILLGISLRALVTASLFRIFGPRARPWFERHAAAGFLILFLLGFAGLAGYFLLRG